MSLDIWVESPSSCPKCGGPVPRLQSPCDSMNITHNVGNMWVRAGISDAFYSSDGWTITQPYIQMLRSGLSVFKSEYEEFEKLDSPNGWGKAEHALLFLQKWIQMCEANVGCTIRVSR